MENVFCARSIPVRTGPVAFSKRSVGPVVANKLYLKIRSAFICRWQQDSQHVVTKRRVGQSEHAPVGSRRARDLSLLAAVHVNLRRCKPVGAARLHLNEAERFSFISHHVNLHVNQDAQTISPDRKGEICGDDSETSLLEISSRELFTATAQR